MGPAVENNLMRCQLARNGRAVSRQTRGRHILSNSITAALKLFSNRYKLADLSNAKKKKNITQRKEFNLTAAALVVNGLDAGSRLHVARFAKSKGQKAIRLVLPLPLPLPLRGCIFGSFGGVMSLARVTWLCWG